MKRRSFLKSIIAAVAMAPVLARFTLEQPPKRFLSSDELTRLFEEEARGMTDRIIARMSLPSPWVVMSEGFFPSATIAEA